MAASALAIEGETRLAGVSVKAGVDALRDEFPEPGAFIVPWLLVQGRGVRDPSPFSLALGDWPHVALAPPAVEGHVGVPEGILNGQHQASPSQMLLAVFERRSCFIKQVGKGVFVLFNALPLPRGPCGAQVGVVNDFQAPGASQLGFPHFARFGVK